MTAMKAAMQAIENENMPYARRRWLILATVATAQLMIVLDLTIVNVALPSAQRSLHFATVDRQWVVTAYSLAFGSLLLLGGRLADLLGRKATFMVGLAGFAVASAVGGASVNFAMLVTTRATQGAFAAVMAPSALSILTNTFTDAKDRGKAFAVFGAIAGAGASVGLLLGGALTEYLSWRWTLYVNLLFAGAALAGAAVLLTREPARGGQRLDLPGAVLAGGALFCLVYGFANAATHSWGTPSTWGFFAAAAPGLAAFAARQARAKDPLLPPRVVLDRNRGGAYLAMLFVSAGVFGIFLFLAFYLQTTLGYSPLVTGLAFLPFTAAVVVSVNVAQIVLMPRTGPKPLIGLGLLIAAGGMVWLTRIGVHSGYASAILGPTLVTGLGIGQVTAPALNTGTYGVAPHDAGVASATVNVGQQVGGSIGASLLNTMVASATASYLASHLNRGTRHASAALVQQSTVHGYVVGFWWTAGIFAAGAVVCGTLLPRGPLRPRQAPAATAAEPRAVPSEPPSVLHDGAQQRLASLALQLPAAQMAVPPGAGELAQRLDGAIIEATGVLEELHEIARGLHAAVLIEGGLSPALRALARRSAVPVRLEVQVTGRLPEPVETAAYYAVAEALTNMAKHAQASAAEVKVTCGGGVLQVRVRDDGRGGADFGRGSGLAGLKDRVEALGGLIWLKSPPGAGTTVQIVLPLAPASRERRAGERAGTARPGWQAGEAAREPRSVR
jgi:EmrB/QacA subfamily drug resistance transporter